MPSPKPLFRDFMGLNVHTVQFRPELYLPVCRLLRDYHNIDWDLGTDTSSKTLFPMTRNGVNWKDLYGSWVRSGYEINVCAQFGAIKQEIWKDIRQDPYRYGLDFARFFGPSGNRLATSIEIGNEPGDYSDANYRTLFESMAKGLREGDPKLTVVTCATFAKKSGAYHKSLDCVKGLDPLYDVINLHSYPQAEGWPTWRRSYPEDPSLEYLKDIRDVIAWRDANAPGKPVWLTEFGYDATTQPQAKEGTFSKWVGVTDLQQARYIVRSFLVFAPLDMARSYLYWFNDEDKASVHAAAGITRHYQPKPSYHAMAHLYKTLGDYRFAKVVKAVPGDVYVYEFVHGMDSKRRVWAIWSPTGTDRKSMATLDAIPGKVEKAEQMPLIAGAPYPVRYTPGGKKGITLNIDETPVYVWFRG